MNRTIVLSSILALCAAVPSAAHAGEVFGGVLAHGVDTPFSLETGERGADVELGYRFDKSEALGFLGKPSPYVFGSVNTQGNTDFVAAGLSWKLPVGKLFARPGIGLSYNDGPSLRIAPDGSHTELGSRVLFEPEIALGMALGERTTLEASWVHISGARLFNSQQNPGLDMMGVRLSRRL